MVATVIQNSEKERYERDDWKNWSLVELSLYLSPLKSGKWANELPRQITASKPGPGF